MTRATLAGLLALAAAACGNAQPDGGAPDAALDLAVPAGDLAAAVDAGAVGCGDAACAVGTAVCCTATFGVSGACAAADGGCATAFACDGPEDCAPGRDCCLDWFAPNAMVARCGVCTRDALCHTDDDCADPTPACCPLRYSAVAAYRACSASPCAVFDFGFVPDAGAD